ncbi:MAG: hypothetical protein ACXAC7_03785 [Candidatus Hodarchaeales archaeon]|jgi:hypothetical protein
MADTFSNSSLTLSPEEIYELFLLFQGLDDLKRSLIMVLSHIYPKQVTATQLAVLAGYSKSSKHIFKSGALTSLTTENLIKIQRPTKRLMLIQISPNHSLLMKFSNICQKVGIHVQETLLGKLLEEEFN